MAETPNDYFDQRIADIEILKLNKVIRSFNPENLPLDFIVRLILKHSQFFDYSSLKRLIADRYSRDYKILNLVEGDIRSDINEYIGDMEITQEDFNAATTYDKQIKRN